MLTQLRFTWAALVKLFGESGVAVLRL